MCPRRGRLLVRREARRFRHASTPWQGERGYVLHLKDRQQAFVGRRL